MSQSCTYTFKGADGRKTTIEGASALKAYLATGGLEFLLGEARADLARRPQQVLASQGREGDWNRLPGTHATKAVAEAAVKVKVNGAKGTKPNLAWREYEFRIGQGSDDQWYVDARKRPGAASMKLSDKISYEGVTRSANRQIDTPEFKTWSGGNPVVLAAEASRHQFETGSPVVVEGFHGTRRNFDRVDTAQASAGYFLTSKPLVADEYAGVYPEGMGGGSFPLGGNVQRQYVRMDNPLVVNARGASFNRVDTRAIPGYPLQMSNTDAINQWAKSRGYDGIIYKDLRDSLSRPDGRNAPPSNVYVTFKPSFVKSAIGNSGEYSLEEESFLASRDRVTETPEFKAWFKDSKVVDAEGKPLVVYHGTTASFDVFDLAKTSLGMLGEGFYFARNPVAAASYARLQAVRKVDAAQNVMPAFLSLQNPFVMGQLPAGMPSRDRLIAQGYDGIIFENQIVAFRPTQIKSAIGNRGTFGLDDSDITRSSGRDLKPVSIEQDSKEWAVRGKPTITLNNAEFGGGSVVQWVDGDKENYITFIAAYGDARGHEMLRWLKRHTGKPSFAVSAVDDAIGFYERMGEVGLMSGYTQDTVDSFFGIDFGDGEPQRYAGDVRFNRDDARRSAERDYPKISEFAGMSLRRATANINATADSAFGGDPYRVLPGVREVPFSDFVLQGEEAGIFDTTEQRRRIDELAAAIKKSGSIEPLFISAPASGGMFLSEGQHRARALRKLGYSSVPARIIRQDASGTTRPTIIRSAERGPLGFYSALAKGIEDLPTKQAPAGAWKAAIKGLVNRGAAKADEVEWSGINDWLDLQQGKATKEQVSEYLKQGGVKVEETVLGSATLPPGYRIEVEQAGNEDPYYRLLNEDGDVVGEGYSRDDAIDEAGIAVHDVKYSKYTLPGGANYREVLLTLPDKDANRLYQLEIKVNGGTATLAERQEYGDLIDSSRGKGAFRSNHWEQANVLAHIRVNDRTDADGKRVLFVEELQSDWQQSNRKAIGGLAKPDGVLESLEKIFGREVASAVALDRVDAGVLPAVKHDQVRRAIVAALPVDVVNDLGGQEAATKKLFGESDVPVPSLAADGLQRVADSLAVALSSTGARLRAKLSALRDAGRDGEVLPTLLASQLHPREVVRLFADPAPDHDSLAGSPRGGDAAVDGAEALRGSGEPTGRGLQRGGAVGAGADSGRGPARSRAESGVVGPARPDGEAGPAGLASLLDWHNRISNSGSNTLYVPGPFVGSTGAVLALALKRIMVMAAEGGYDKVAFVNGEQSAERYDLSKQVDYIQWNPGYDGVRKLVQLEPTDGETIGFTVLQDGTIDDSTRGWDGRQLDEVIGKELATKIMASDQGDLRGLELKVGGEGMKTFYDTIVPTALKKLLPKVGGGRVETVEMLRPVDSDLDPNWGTPKFDPDKWDMNDDGEVVGRQPGFTITPAMREKVSEGLPLFSRDRATWTDERIDRLLSAHAYTMDDSRSKAYAGFVSPEDYLRATTPADSVERLEAEKRPLNEKDLAEEVQPIFLKGEPQDDGTWKTTGHEGRHRMMALRDAGVRRVPVVFDVGYGLKREPIEGLYVTPQRWSGAGSAQGGFFVDGLIPISYKHADDLRDAFGGEGAVRFSPDRAQTQTPEFKAWFKDSKVVNPLGRPRVVYHGTAGDVAIFDMGRAGQTYGLKDEQAFFFTGRIPTAQSAADDATGLPAYTRKYAYQGFGGGDQGDYGDNYSDEPYDISADYNGGQNLMPVYLSLQNPLIIDAPYGRGAGVAFENGREAPGQLIERAKRQGHDGIIIRGKYRNMEQMARILANTWTTEADKKKYLDELARQDARKHQTDHYFIAFRSDQIKSAIGNVGAYGQRQITEEEANRFGMGAMEANFRQYEGDIRFSVDRDYRPEKTVKAYKLFRMDERRPGELFPLFVDADRPVPMGEWLSAQAGPAAAGGKVKSKLGPLAYRPGWHAGDLPVATHIGMKKSASDGKPGLRNPEHVWAEVEMAADIDWQAEANKRGTNKDGKVVPVKAHITDEIPRRGFYRYKTNPNMTGNWLIGGEMRVLRLLPDSEVQRINRDAGVADLPRKEPLDLARFGFASAPDITKSSDRQTDTPEFKRWFGDSKVVDGRGRPLVVYHGSPARDFTVFDLDKVNATDPDGPYNGFWFSSNEDEATTAGSFPWGRPNATSPQTRAFYLSIENPATRAQAGRVAREIENDYEVRHPSARSLQDAVRLELQARGFDGVVHSPAAFPSKEEFDRTGEVRLKDGIRLARGENGFVDYYAGDEYITDFESFEEAVKSLGAGTFVAFRPEQIKSATGNTGAFDPANPDITKSAGRRPPGFKSADRVQPDFVADDEEEANAKYAEFDDGGAYVKFFADNKGSLRVITINAEESQSVSGRGILQWLRGTYNMPIIANEVDMPAIGFWDKMQSEGLVVGWSHQMYRGKTRKLPDITKSADRDDRATSAWQSPSASKFDDWVYKLQDKQIDTKRVVDEIKDVAGALADDLDVYLQEELFHGRAAKRTEDFVNKELRPLVDAMARDGLKIEDLDTFLHARHAREANAVIAQRNPEIQDGGSGMTNQDAADYFANLDEAQRRKLEAAAAKVDAILAETRKMMVDYQLESPDVIKGWGQMFQHYVPLMREDEGAGAGAGIGQGFSIKGREVKSRTGSTRKVVDIFANIAMQRERTIVRGEKNRVSQALHGLATASPNKEFWTVDKVPTTPTFNPATGLVEDRPDNLFKMRDNVIVSKVLEQDDEGRTVAREKAVIFNEKNERAVRMATALKNLDAAQLEGLMGASAAVTRYFASINTQYNPVFGIINLMRDVQGAIVNLNTTELKDDKLKVAKGTMSALMGIMADARKARRGEAGTSEWSALWEDFQSVGGQTGYRQLFQTSADRAKDIQRALNPDAWMDSRWGRIFTAGGTLKVPLSVAMKGARWLFDLLSDYNLAMENGIRLSAYKVALDKGMSRERAASLAKNLTVNFNRKGQVGQQAGALYAFFNAAMQGTARLGQTLFEMEPGKPKTIRLSSLGKKIVYGGMLLGTTQALALAAAGFSDDDPPDFVRERSLIIPTGGKTYISIPMPLGLHVIPNVGRVTTEWALGGFKNTPQRVASLLGTFADSFNPIGNAGWSFQTLAPTAFDPLVALTENKDWQGRPIAKESMNRDMPGPRLHRDTATSWGKLISESINYLSGGDKYSRGVLSPTPDQIDYLIGQLTGGVGREISKVEQTAFGLVRGEEIPTYKVPLVGRLIGDSKSQASEGTAFYANAQKLNKLETEIKLLREDGKTDEAQALRASRPEAYLMTQANYAERAIQRLRKEKSELIKDGAPREKIREIEERITARMAGLNRAMEALEAAR